MKKQRILIAGLCAAVLCVVCLGLELWNHAGRNAELKAQVEALTEENEKLTKDVDSLRETNRQYADDRYEADAARAAAVNKLTEVEEQLEELAAEAERQEYRAQAKGTSRRELYEIWQETELKLAALQETSFSNETVSDALYWYYRLVNSYHCTPLNILSTLGLREYDQTMWEMVELTDPEKNYDLPWTGDGGASYFKTDVTEKEYREALLQYLSERLMESRFFDATVVRDGYIYILDGGASGYYYEIAEVECISGSLYRAVVENHWWDGITLFEVEFGVENADGNCVITAVRNIEE